MARVRRGVVLEARRHGHQARARPAGLAADRVVDEGERAVRAVADDELGLALDHRPVAGLALLQRPLGVLARRDLAADRLDLDQPALVVEEGGVGPLLVAHAARRLGVRLLELVGDGRPLGGEPGPGGVDPRPLVRRVVADVVVAREQHLARQAAVAAVGVVREDDAAVRAQAQDQLGLGLDHRAVAGLALLQRVLGPDPLADVALDGDDVREPPAGVAHRRDGGLLEEEAAVLVPAGELPLPDLAPLERGADRGEEGRVVAVAAQELGRAVAERLLAAPPGQAGEGRVDVGEAVVGVRDLDRNRRPGRARWPGGCSRARGASAR